MSVFQPVSSHPQQGTKERTPGLWAWRFGASLVAAEVPMPFVGIGAWSLEFFFLSPFVTCLSPFDGKKYFAAPEILFVEPLE